MLGQTKSVRAKNKWIFNPEMDWYQRFGSQSTL